MSPSSSGVSSLGSSWNSPTLTQPFPLPTPSPPSPSVNTPFASDSPVCALLELSGDLIRVEEKGTDSDEGIVSDNSFEEEDNHKRKKVRRTNDQIHRGAPLLKRCYSANFSNLNKNAATRCNTRLSMQYRVYRFNNLARKTLKQINFIF